MMEKVANISGDASKKGSRFPTIDGVAAECYEHGSLATGPKEDKLISSRPTNQSLLDRAVETHQRFSLDKLSQRIVVRTFIYLFLNRQHH